MDVNQVEINRHQEQDHLGTGACDLSNSTCAVHEEQELGERRVSVLLMVARLKWAQRQQAFETLLTHIYDTGADESPPDTCAGVTRTPKAFWEALQWPVQIKLTANPRSRQKTIKKQPPPERQDVDVNEGGDSGIARTKFRCSQWFVFMSTGEIEHIPSSFRTNLPPFSRE
jgi:hypothetical protein